MNLCKARHRQEQRRREALERLELPRAAVNEVNEVLDVLDRLPFRQRAVIVLRYFSDLSELEIAETLQCRPGTVKSLSSRALERLRRELES